MSALLRIDAAARDLGLPVKALRRAAEQHGLLVRIGSAVRIEEASIPELIALCRSAPKAPASTSTPPANAGSSATQADPRLRQALTTAASLKRLAAYIVGRDRPSGPAEPAVMTIAMALDYYGREHASTVAAPERIGYAIEALLPFWGALPVAAIKGETCRRYARQRVTRQGVAASASTVRRELGVLQAALGHCVREGHLTSAPTVSLPDAAPAKERWLTRAEVAALIRAARSSVRAKHLARFILVGVYTGTRKAALLRLRFQAHTGGGWVDTENGLLYRRGASQRKTAKRQPPARLPRRLLSHLQRWEASGARWVVEYQGVAASDIKTGWAAICKIAGIEGATLHTLRHTAITWAMQSGARPWDAASYFGASMRTIESVYGHHSPDHQSTARRAMETR